MAFFNVCILFFVYSLESDSDSELNSNSDSDVMIMSVEPGHASEQLIRLVPFERQHRLILFMCTFPYNWELLNRYSIVVLINVHTCMYC